MRRVRVWDSISVVVAETGSPVGAERSGTFPPITVRLLELSSEKTMLEDSFSMRES